MKPVVFALTGIALTAQLLAAQVLAEDEKISYSAIEVVSGIYMLSGQGGFGGGNVGLLIGDDKIVLIDDTMPHTAEALLETARSISGRSIDFIINTHLHGDHVGGNAMAARDGALIYAHDNIRKRLVADPKDAGGPAGLPVITFSDRVTFHVNGHTAKAFHIEHAHTDGDAAILFKEANVLHTGDMMFHKLFPFVDLDNGGSVDGYIKAQQHMLSIIDDNTKIIPGHGPLAIKADLETDLAVLIDSKARIAALVDDGKSIEDILEINPLADYHDVYNWAFITTERMTRTLHRDLSGE